MSMTIKPHRFAFDRLLSPISVAQFIQEYWETKPLFLQRDAPDFYQGLLSTVDVDFLLNNHLGVSDFPVSLLGGPSDEPSAYYDNKTTTMGLRVQTIYERFQEGATIRIGNTPKFHHALHDLCASFEAILNVPVAINLYLSPRNARAFGAHIDNHDVYIIQLEGRKHWRVYGTPKQLPVEVLIPGRDELFKSRLPGGTPFGLTPPNSDTNDLILEPGDLLYLPRGYAHEVHTKDSQSLHLTIAAPAITWYEALLAALPTVVQGNPLLRAGLPPGFAVNKVIRDGLVKQAEEISKSLYSAITTEQLMVAIEEIATRFNYMRPSLASAKAHDIDNLAQLTIDSIVQVRPHLTFSMVTNREHLYLLFSRNSVKLPIRASSMIEYIHQHPIFRIGDLRTQLDNASRLAVTQSLIQRGLLEIVDINGQQPIS